MQRFAQIWRYCEGSVGPKIHCFKLAEMLNGQPAVYVQRLTEHVDTMQCQWNENPGIQPMQARARMVQFALFHINYIQTMPVHSDNTSTPLQGYLHLCKAIYTVVRLSTPLQHQYTVVRLSTPLQCQYIVTTHFSPYNASTPCNAIYTMPVPTPRHTMV